MNVKNLPESAKMFLAGMITMIIVFALVVATMALSSFTNQFIGSSGSSSTASNSSSSISQLPLNLYDTPYVLVKYDELPLYPQVWLSSQFTDEEIAKPQLAAPEIDADGDGLTNRQEYLFAANPKKKDSFCLLQLQTQSTCEPSTDGDRRDLGFHPKTNAAINTQIEMLLEERFVDNLQDFKAIIDEAEEKKFSFPDLFAAATLQDVSGIYPQFANEIVVLEDDYGLRIKEEQMIIASRELQFFVEIMEAYKKNTLPEVLKKYDERIENINQTKAKPQHQKLQTINTALYVTAKKIVADLAQNPVNITDIQKSFVTLFAMVRDFNTEYSSVRSLNLLP